VILDWIATVNPDCFRARSYERYLSFHGVKATDITDPESDLMIQPRGELSGDWHLDLEEAQVILVSLDYRLSFTVTDDSLTRLNVVLKSPFIARLGPDPDECRLDPSTTDPDLGRFAVSLKTQRLVECRGTSAGVLLLRFDGGASVMLGPSDRYQAWEVAYAPSEDNAASFHIVCLPGGERALWGSDT
jgi:hypothetical protein